MVHRRSKKDANEAAELAGVGEVAPAAAATMFGASVASGAGSALAGAEFGWRKCVIFCMVNWKSVMGKMGRVGLKKKKKKGFETKEKEKKNF